MSPPNVPGKHVINHQLDRLLLFICLQKKKWNKINSKNWNFELESCRFSFLSSILSTHCLTKRIHWASVDSSVSEHTGAALMTKNNVNRSGSGGIHLGSLRVPSRQMTNCKNNNRYILHGWGEGGGGLMARGRAAEGGRRCRWFERQGYPGTNTFIIPRREEARARHNRIVSVRSGCAGPLRGLFPSLGVHGYLSP